MSFIIPAADHLPSSNESNYGLLERCGHWLISIPRDDVAQLQNTAEYRDFLAAFDRLGVAHRRTVTETLMKQENDDMMQISKQHSFLQHLAVDDVLLRVFEFIDCSSLVRTGTSCHRFRELSTRSAEQRTHRLADGRLLRNPLKMLRAQEQIEGVGVREGTGPFVPIPMLGLRRRVKVSGAGDPEFNGTYFCTGSNGNGFLFTKPRAPERRAGMNGVVHHAMGLPEIAAMEEDDGGIEDAAIRGGGDDEDDNNVRANEIRDGDLEVLFGDEPNRSRLLRCVIAKRFSNETILWYMSKEEQDSTTHEITHRYSYWAKLMVSGDASPDVCRYPSQTSVLSRNGDPAWQTLSNNEPNNEPISPPIVELLG
eukprot:scaffold21143_cov120-Skeletonema_dohrnii-CCMP3373.AAC.2